MISFNETLLQSQETTKTTAEVPFKLNASTRIRRKSKQDAEVAEIRTGPGPAAQKRAHLPTAIRLLLRI